jgi:hypothetical protein
MLRFVTILRTDITEEPIASTIRVTRISELGTTLALTKTGERSVIRLRVIANVVPSPPILVTLMMEAIRSSETSVLTTFKRFNIPEAGILHSHRCEKLKSYIALIELQQDLECLENTSKGLNPRHIE